MITDCEKERIKLQANALDRSSTACVTVGVLAPVAASLYTGGTTATDWKLFLGSILYLSAALAFHHFARWTLEGLDR